MHLAFLLRSQEHLTLRLMEVFKIQLHLEIEDVASRRDNDMFLHYATHRNESFIWGISKFPQRPFVYAWASRLHERDSITMNVGPNGTRHYESRLLTSRLSRISKSGLPNSILEG